MFRLFAAAALIALMPSVYAQEVVLKLHHPLPTSSTAHKKVLQPWCDKIAAESKGRIKCQIFPSMQLGGTAPQLYDQVKDGVVDLTWTIPNYSAGRFHADRSVRVAVHGARRRGRQQSGVDLCRTTRHG
jgi:TRAP-type C4-dicarboxylate transport system substrate-binding protein